MSENAPDNAALRMRFFLGEESSQGTPEHYTHIQTARLLMQALHQEKALFGTQQRRRTITLSDGTKIEGNSSIGFDELKITLPVRSTTPETSSESTEPPPTQEEEFKREEEEVGQDYLWIGIRPVQPINSEAAGLDGAYSVCGMLIEPDGVHMLLGDAGYEEQGGFFIYNNGPLSDPNSFNYEELELYRSYSPGLYYPPWRSYPEGFETLGVGYNSGDTLGGVRFSPGGVLGYDVVQNAYSMYSSQTISVEGTLLPIDPKAPMTSARYPEGQLGSPANDASWWGDPHWHNVFLLDPYPGLPVEGNQPLRRQDEQARAVAENTIKTLYGKGIRVKSGAYILKVCMFGDCRPNKGQPIEVDIEVRVGKPYQKTPSELVPQTVFKTTVSIPWWSKHPRSVWPYGGAYGNHATEGGPNPHGPMWWQGGLKINVRARTVKEAELLLPEADIGMGRSMFTPGAWDTQHDVCNALVWSPYMLSSFYPGTVPIAATLEGQAYHFARTFYRAIWYSGEQGWGYADIDYSGYNLAPLIAAILGAASAAGKTDLNGTKIIASGDPADLGTRPEPAMKILEISATSSDEWTTLINNGSIYQGQWHHMRAVF